METNWIRFDPDDKLTWPEMESERYSKTVLAYSDGRIHLAHMVHLTKDEFEWFLTNEFKDGLVPLHRVAAAVPDKSKVEFKTLPGQYRLDYDDNGARIVDANEDQEQIDGWEGEA